MRNELVASLIFLTATGCGGGAAPKATPPAAAPVASPPPAPAPPPIAPVSLRGTFSGTYGAGRNISGVVLGNGSLFGIYTAAGNAQGVGGLIQGTGASSNSNAYNASDIKDFSVEGLGVRDASLSATFEESLFFRGTVTYVVSSNTANTFTTSTFDSTSPSSLSAVAGTYNGSLAFAPSSRVNTTLTIDANGVVATSQGGCHITGQVTPTLPGNAFNLSLTLGVSPCSPVNQSFNGAAELNAGTNTLYGGAPSSDRTTAIVFALIKQ